MLTFEKEPFQGTQSILEKLTVSRAIMAGSKLAQAWLTSNCRTCHSTKSNTESTPQMRNHPTNRAVSWSWSPAH